TEQGEKISQNTSSIKANENAIKLKVDNQTYQTDKTNMTSTLNKHTSEISALQDEISLKVEQTDIETANNALKSEIQEDLNDMNERINDILADVGGAIADGIIEESETIMINSSITQLKKEKETLTQRYNYIYNLSTLASSMKSSLKTTMDTYNAKQSALVSHIQSMITDKIISDSERTTYETRLTEYSTALANINKKIEECMDSISTSKVNTAKAEIKVTTDSISQSVTNLSNTVSTKADGSTVSTLSSKVGSLETSVDGITGQVSNLEKSTTSLGSQVSDLEGEINTVKSDVASLEVTTSGISQKVSNVESTTASLTTQVDKAQLTADSKAKVFTSTPTTPYKIGDLWVQGTTGDVMRCKTARSSGSYTASDWEKASKYTDDTKANDVDTKVGTLQTDYSSTKSKVATLETNLNSITQRVSSTESTTATLTTKVNTAQSTADSATTKANNAQTTANTANTQATTNKNNISTLTTTVNNTNSKVSSLETNLNSITSRVSATETTTSSLTTQMNNKEDVNSRVIYAKGNGNDAPSNSIVKVGSSTLVSGHGRGLNIVALNPTTLAQYYKGTFDTYGGDNYRTQFAEKIQELNNGNYIIVVTSHDSVCLNYATVCNALYLIGGSAPSTSISSYREAYALIGKSKLGKGNGLEMYIPRTADDARVAEVSVKVSEQGALLGVNSNNSESKIDTLTTRVSTAESKLTKDSLTTTIGSHYTTSTDVNNAITSKGYATTSQVQQTTNALSAKFSSSGGYNLLRNTSFANGTTHWSYNATCTVDSSKKYGNNNSLKMVSSGATSAVWRGANQRFVDNAPSGKTYRATLYYYIENKSTFNSNFALELKGRKTGATSESSFASTSISASNLVQGAWTKVTITATTSVAWDYIYIYPWIHMSGTIWIYDVIVTEGELEVPWSPHPSEIYDGVTTIDKNGVKVSQS
ncbi:MAG: hypothetical protein J6D12_06145, partial [Peptostreptococcaceae bacterium]|nr:hypothetical protein [Peptostreptococcaceae bacterium]